MVTNRLPSDTECQKCLLAPALDDLDEATRSDLLRNRTKCLELIMKVRTYVYPICCVISLYVHVYVVVHLSIYID